MGKGKRIFTFSMLAHMLIFAGCQFGTVEIEYVFPDGFRGAALIREKQTDGIAPL